MQLIKIDDNWLSKIEVVRHAEAEDGFQRKLNMNRAKEISSYMKNGHDVAPIYIGKIGDRYICIDGQHRLEARKMKPFNLYGIVVEKDLKTATDEFEAMNTMNAKVSLSHRLKISNVPLAKFIRGCASKHGVDVKTVYAIVKGLSVWNALRDYRGEFPKAIKDKTEIILEFWMKDKRWKSKSSVYSKPGILTVVGQLCRKKSSIKPLLKQLASLDYSKQGSLYIHYGTGGACLKFMRDYILKRLFNNSDYE